MATSVPNLYLQRAIKIIEEYKFIKLELQAKDSALTKALKQIATKNVQITSYRKQIADLKKINTNNERQIKLLSQQNEIANGSILSWQGQVKKQKTSKWIIVAGAVVAVFTTAYILK